MNQRARLFFPIGRTVIGCLKRCGRGDDGPKYGRDDNG